MLAGRIQVVGLEPAMALRAREARAFVKMAAPEEEAGTEGVAVTVLLAEEDLVTLWVQFGRTSRE